MTTQASGPVHRAVRPGAPRARGVVRPRRGTVRARRGRRRHGRLVVGRAGHRHPDPHLADRHRSSPRCWRRSWCSIGPAPGRPAGGASARWPVGACVVDAIVIGYEMSGAADPLSEPARAAARGRAARGRLPRPAQLAAGRRARRQRRHRVDRRDRGGRRRRDHRPDHDPDRRRRRPGRRRAEHGAPGSTSRSAPSATPSWRCWTRSAASSATTRSTSSRSWPASTWRRASPRTWRSRSPSSSPSTTPSARTPRPSSASTPTTSPARGAAAFASMVAFTLGALLPLLTITLVGAGRPGAGHGRVGRGRPRAHRLDQRQALLRARPGRAVLRNVAGGLLAMGVTFAIGSLLGTQV